VRALFLDQLRGMESVHGILVLGATDAPWTLDAGIRRCFEDRIYIPLPDDEARAAIFELLLRQAAHKLTTADFATLAGKTAGYSGADICLVTREASMAPVRKIQGATHFKKVPWPPGRPGAVQPFRWTPCSPADIGAEEMTFADVPADLLLVPDVTYSDMEGAIDSCPRSSSRAESVALYQRFELGMPRVAAT
jgi:vacuolar protein-sorting-associated protein 4